MKIRAVKLWLGKVALKGIKMPQTSYQMLTYTDSNGKLHHQKAEKAVQAYTRNSSPNQRKFGINYKKGAIRTRTMNVTDLATLTNNRAAKARPVAAMATRIYTNAISKAVKVAAVQIIKICSQHRNQRINHERRNVSKFCNR